MGGPKDNRYSINWKRANTMVNLAKEAYFKSCKRKIKAVVKDHETGIFFDVPMATYRQAEGINISSLKDMASVRRTTGPRLPSHRAIQRLRRSSAQSRTAPFWRMISLALWSSQTTTTGAPRRERRGRPHKPSNQLIGRRPPISLGW